MIETKNSERDAKSKASMKEQQLKEKKHAEKVIIGFTLFFLFLSSVQAAIVTGNMNVSATIAPSCSFTVNNLNFGSYDPTKTSPTDSTTTITVKCTLNTSYTISMNAGTSSGASIEDRRMACGSEILRYNLYTDNTYSTIWGDGTSGSTVGGTGAGVNTGVNHTVYGRMTSLQDSPAGTYQDVVTITITY